MGCRMVEGGSPFFAEKENKMTVGSRLKWSAGLVVLGVTPAAMAAQAEAIKWDTVPTSTITLFWPGQSTYQWLRSAEHPGAQPSAGGTACVACHKGQEARLGKALVREHKLEPTPVPGKDPVKELRFQAAYDDQNAYFRFQWRTANKYPGEHYPMLRYDGKEWRPYGGPRLTQAVRSGAQPPLYEDRLSIMIDDGRVPGFAAQGCWLTCHDGQRDSRSQPTAGEVKESVFFKIIKQADVRKYLPATRTDAAASWNAPKSPEEIAKLKAEGHFLDLIQWRAHRSNPVGMGDDGFVLDYRRFDDGRNPWSSNFDAKAGQPRYMYDAAKTGRNALAAEDLRKGPSALVREQNAVAFDPKVPWKTGDLLPSNVVSRTDAKGSAADNSEVRGVWTDGMWTVTWVRPLNLANPDDKALREGSAYNFAFAVHDDNITTRGHTVSFPLTVGFGAKAAIQATRIGK
jgi:hypothetical protein